LRPLVPIHQFDRLPSFYIFAGLVFTPLTQPYLHEYGDDWYNTSPRRLCDRALTANPTKPGEQLVILSQVLMDEINVGYERLAELQVCFSHCYFFLLFLIVAMNFFSYFVLFQSHSKCGQSCYFIDDGHLQGIL
jgi:hypothetical protein